MPYTAERPPATRTTEELRATVPGWGADLDRADRPSHPREVALETGAHWDLPERQDAGAARERSIEHAMLTPVFGTAQPLGRVSGLVRRIAYRRYGEGRLAHWLLLVAGDRVDVAEHRVGDLLRGRPDRLIRETGVRAELTHGGLSSRWRRGRTDWKHQWMDPFVVAGPYLVAGALGLRAARRHLARHRS